MALWYGNYSLVTWFVFDSKYCLIGWEDLQVVGYKGNPIYLIILNALFSTENLYTY